jgi:hypothetical protein
MNMVKFRKENSPQVGGGRRALYLKWMTVAPDMRSHQSLGSLKKGAEKILTKETQN